jgi:hypothetical protein
MHLLGRSAAVIPGLDDVVEVGVLLTNPGDPTGMSE